MVLNPSTAAPHHFSMASSSSSSSSSTPAQCCAFVNCGGTIEDGDGFVVLATDERLRKRLPKKKPILIRWTPKGQVKLHRQCWEACRGRGRRQRGIEMSQTERNMVASSDETAEYHDPLQVVREKAQATAALLKGQGKTAVAFTGAGISAAAGIPTYRGTDGIDTKAEMHHDETAAVVVVVDDQQGTDNEEEEEEFTDYSALRPTVTHKALVELEKRNVLIYTASQNCDDLHGKAGTSRDKLTELHGNVFVEVCERCHKEYVRDFEVDAYSTGCSAEPWYVECPDCKWNHYTGHKCSKKRCKGKLRDTIVNFGDPLHSMTLGGLKKAAERFEHADVCLALGSSLTVHPANALPLLPQALVIVNLQQTDLDEHATVSVSPIRWSLYLCVCVCVLIFFMGLLGDFWSTDPRLLHIRLVHAFGVGSA